MNRKKVALSVLAATIFVASTYAQERTAVNSRVRLRSVGPKALPANLPAGGDVFAITVGAFEFAPEGSTLPYVANSVAGGEYLMVGSGPGQTNVLSNINLPTGAVIQSIELDACDVDPIEDLSLFLLDCLDDVGGPGACNGVIQVTSSGSGGCAFVNSGPLGVSIDNTNHDYLLEAYLPGSVNVGFRGVKIYYFLQVSPAPATATFNDVPTSDPAFQFIEAFAAAGITAGCQANPPLYCPDNNVTRRQMAVFFAKALGLRWPG